MTYEKELHLALESQNTTSEVLYSMILPPAEQPLHNLQKRGKATS